MKKVVFFIVGLDSGGMENYLLRFLQFKAKDFEEIIVFCKGGKGGQLEADFLKIPNVKIIKKPISFFNPMHYIRLFLYFRKEKFYSICDFTGNFAGLVLFSARVASIKKRIVFYRNSSYRFKKSPLRLIYNNFIKHITYINATHILSNSQSAFNFYFKKSELDERFHVIYNGIDAEKFNINNLNLRNKLNIPQDAFVVGHTGRFNPAKNHQVIIEVAKLLIEKYQDIYFILCGNGVKEGLINIVKEQNIDNKVLLFDNRSDIPVFLNTMDAFIFPSFTEGQPNSLIEAMIVGLPYVASDIEPIREMVKNNVNLFNPNDINNFEKTLESFYLNKNQRNLKLKDEMIKKFNYKVRFEEFYKILA